MKRPILVILATLVLVGGWATRLVWRAMHDIVTLEVNNVPVRDVVAKLKRQTWESIYVNKDVQGYITLNVKNASLETVLEILSEQLDNRWQPVYAIYRRKPALKSFEKLLMGNADTAQVPWTNWNTRADLGGFLRAMAGGESARAGGSEPGGPAGGAGSMGGFMGRMSPSSGPLTLAISNQPVADAIQQLRRASRAKLVPEDSVQGTVDLILDQTPLDAAVDRLSAQVHSHWSKYYSIGDRSRPQLSDDDRKVMETLRPDREQAHEQMKARFEAMANDPAAQDRVVNRDKQTLRNTTPEQRAMRAGRGGFGGPGRGGPGGSGR